MKKKFPNQFKFFDQEEKEIVEAFERGEFVPVKNQEEYKKNLMEAARNTPKDYHGDKIDVLTITIDSNVAEKLKSKAKNMKVRYQDLASSVLQKFANS